MNHTTNLNLNLPEYADEADIASMNSNMQTIDYAVGDIDDDIAMKVTQPSGGTAGQVLEMGSNGEVKWGEKIPTTDIVEVVADWLDTNMPPQETIIVDNTLSTPHAAAEAKATGDALSALDAKKPGVRSTNADDVDLDIADQNGNVLVRMKDGHIQTKNFDSSDIEDRLSGAEDDIDDLHEDVSDIDDRLTDAEGDIDDLETAVAGKQDTLTFDNVPVQNSSNPVKSGGVYSALQEIPKDVSVKETDASGVDLDVTDNSGNVIARFSDGHFQTKEFDSRDMEALVPEAEQSDVGKALVAKTVSGGKVTEYALREAGSSGTSVRDTTVSGVDLDIADQSGNVVARLKNGHIQTKCFNSTKYGAKVITIKKDGSGDFSVLSTALASITDADYETNPYEIHIYPGTYNTLEGYTDEEIRSADIGGGYTDDSFVGAKLKDGVSLIGIGDRSQIILTAELSTSDYTLSVRGNISTLNLQGSCRIENLTIKAKNIRYCIHDDFGTTKHCTRIVKNCVFVPLGNLAYHPATTYGAGIRNPGMTGLFEDCDFGFSWGMHTRQLMTGGSNIVLRNCSGLAARIGDNAYESDTVNHLYIFDDCNFQMIQITRQSATTPHVEVAGTNNFNTMMISPDGDCPQIYNLIKTEASNLPVGAVVNVGIGEITATSNGIHAVKAANIESALGVIVFKDSVYDYIQSNGYIQGKRLGISSLSVGDYITVNSDMKLVSGGTVSNAFGVVRYTDSSDNSQIWIIRR